ncbi:unnamed protein product [Protopolystoma xenopodis]|uniref:Uncharacterized protein n=1 Tax=Protopolystoma xenopodis TaxID=117903 RepID=A0A448WFN6_9PLAT|nr:unnamed protein product [Protopolystoma xenopodis]
MLVCAAMGHLETGYRERPVFYSLPSVPRKAAGETDWLLQDRRLGAQLCLPNSRLPTVAVTQTVTRVD